MDIIIHAYVTFKAVYICIVLRIMCVYCCGFFQIKDYTRKIAQRFEITGPLNMQFLVKGDEVKVIS